MKKTLAVLLLFITLIPAMELTKEKASDFTLKNLKGKNYTLSKNLNGLKVVNFWATWCVPCIGEMTELSKLHEEFTDQGVEFVSISVDDNKSSAKVPSFVRSRKWPFTILLDPQKEAYRKLHVSNVPTVMVINKEQEVVYKHSGFSPGDEKHLREVILKALQ